MENISVQNVNNNKKNMMFIVLIFALSIVVAGLGVTLAFLTKNTEKRANLFTFGNVSIELTEDEWNKLPPEDKIIYPEKTIPKDPVITNTGKNDAYVYMEVKVPMAKVRTYDEKGGINDAAMQELFKFDVNQDSRWQLLEDVEDMEESSEYNNYTVYLYVYNQSLSPTESTPPLFDEVKVIPMLEGELEMDSSIEIPITAYAIQADLISEPKDFKTVFENHIKDKN